MTAVIIPFVRVAADQNPNDRSIDDDDAVSSYLRAAACCLASVARWNPHFKLIFATNAPPPEWFSSLLESLDARVELVPFRHRPPVGFVSTFEGSFFLLDALAEVAFNETAIFMDPDVVCVGPLDALVKASAEGVGAIRLEYEPSRVVNGTTGRAATRFAVALGEEDSLTPHFGGELYVVPYTARATLSDRCELAWQRSLANFTDGLPYLTTEEHIINFALRSMRTIEMNAFARRVWTAHRYRNVDGSERELALWHLPAEKNRGFRILWREFNRPGSWFWNAPPSVFGERAGRIFGLWRRAPIRFMKDTVGASIAARQRRDG